MMLPRSPAPARSSSRGSISKTEGVYPGSWELADGQADLPLRPGDPGDRVHHEEDVLSAVPEILGDGRGREGGLEADQGGLIRGGDDDHRSLPPLGAEVPVDEFPDLPPPLPHEGDDVYVRRRVPGHHGQQRALPHSRPREDAYPLSRPQGEQAVHDLHPYGERRGDHLTPQRVRGVCIEGVNV
ncbi:hypothetical protein MASR2M17_13950 [Aminivibrio sp.]